MKKGILCLVLIFLVFISSCGIEFSKENEEKKKVTSLNKYSSTEVIVKFKDDFNLMNIPKYYEMPTSIGNEYTKEIFPRSVRNIFSKNDIKNIKRLSSSENVVLFEIEGNVHDAVKDFKENSNVIDANLNYQIELFDYPNDPLFNFSWALDNVGQDHIIGGLGLFDADIDFPEALDLGYGTDEIIVAVIDSGIDYNHEDLVDNLWINELELNGVEGIDDDGNNFIDDIYGYNFVAEGDSNVTDTIGHGTHCAGIISAKINNSLGISGVCPNCKIMSLKIFPGGFQSDAIEAFSYAIDNGAKILSNSWGCDGGCSSGQIEDTVLSASESGVLVVFAAGNDNMDMSQIYYSPQSMEDGSENILVVASTDSFDQKSSFSNYGPNIDVSAPGTKILSLRANNTDMYCDENPSLCGDFIFDGMGNLNSEGEYYVASGTSMATPFVSGLAGLIWSHNLNYTNYQVNNHLRTYLIN